MKLINVGACGYVGRSVQTLFPEAIKHDPPAGITADLSVQYDFAFVNVPTPMKEDGSCDTSIVTEAVCAVSADIFIIRSTISPGTTDRLQSMVWDEPIDFIFQPEYVAGDSIYPAPLGDIKNHPFIILGGRPEATKKARRLYERVYPPTVNIFECSAKTAEVIKYAENAYIASKVIFCNELHNICKAFKVDYDQVREGVFKLDPRMTEWWTLSEGKGYKSKCLDKDIPAFIAATREAGYDAEFLESVVYNNERFKGGLK